MNHHLHKTALRLVVDSRAAGGSGHVGGLGLPKTPCTAAEIPSLADLHGGPMCRPEQRPLLLRTATPVLQAAASACCEQDLVAATILRSPTAISGADSMNQSLVHRRLLCRRCLDLEGFCTEAYPSYIKRAVQLCRGTAPCRTTRRSVRKHSKRMRHRVAEVLTR